jgi:hypothetical protein
MEHESLADAQIGAEDPRWIGVIRPTQLLDYVLPRELHRVQEPWRTINFKSSVCRLLSVAIQPTAAMGATPRKAKRDRPNVKGAATTQTTPVNQQVTVIHPSALLFLLIARAICSSMDPWFKEASF